MLLIFIGVILLWNQIKSFMILKFSAVFNSALTIFSSSEHNEAYNSLEV